MSGPVILLWLTLILPPMSGEAITDAPMSDEQAAVLGILQDTPSWERPAVRARAGHPVRALGEPIAATETETEEESSGSGPEGLAPLAVLPFDPDDPGRSALRSSSAMPGRSNRPVTRLRC